MWELWSEVVLLILLFRGNATSSRCLPLVMVTNCTSVRAARVILQQGQCNVGLAPGRSLTDYTHINILLSKLSIVYA